MQSAKKPASAELKAADQALRRAVLKVKQEAKKNGTKLVVLENADTQNEMVDTKAEQAH